MDAVEQDLDHLTEMPDRQGWSKLPWVFLGMSLPVARMLAAVGSTLVLIENTPPDPQSGLLFITTVPLGYALGSAIAMLLAWICERQNPSAQGQQTRYSLTWTGVEIPMGVAIIGFFIVSAIL